MKHGIRKTLIFSALATALGVTLGAASPVLGQDAADPAADGEEAKTAELAQKLNNPLASLISVPFQNNLEFGAGPEDAMRYTLNIQPVIPFELTEDFNLITRTIVPVLYAEEPVAGFGNKSGLGDIQQSLWFTPVEPVVGDMTLGVGPALLYPSATDDALGFGKLALGPTIIALQQTGGWTYAMMANHLWSVAGEGGRDDVSASLLWPIVSYTTKTFTTFGANVPALYDWEHDQWTVPLTAMVAQMVKVGDLPVQLMAGAIYYANKPDGSPDWGLRFAITFVLAK